MNKKNKIHLIGGDAAKENKQQDLKNYTIKVKITDRMMKPRDLDFTDTKERVSFEEVVEVNNVGNDVDASLGATTILNKLWPIKTFNIDIISVKEIK